MALLSAPLPPNAERATRQAWAERVVVIRAAAAAVLAKHVTARHPGAFPDEAPFLALIAEALPEAFARGDHFTLDALGLRSRPPRP
jgi:hypothetical protein